MTIGRIITEVDELRGIALRLAEADADAFTAVTGARTLSQSTEEEKAGRSAAIAQALAVLSTFRIGMLALFQHFGITAARAA